MASMAIVVVTPPPHLSVTSEGEREALGRLQERPESIFSAGLGNLTTTVVAIWSDVVAQMSLTALRIGRERWAGQCVVRAAHSTLGTSLFVLLYSHLEDLLILLK